MRRFDFVLAQNMVVRVKRLQLKAIEKQYPQKGSLEKPHQPEVLWKMSVILEELIKARREGAIAIAYEAIGELVACTTEERYFVCQYTAWS